MRTVFVLSYCIRYKGEEGVGDGPTREFFTLASREFQKRELNLWLSGEGTAEYVFAPCGLFPAPLKFTQTEDQKKRIIVSLVDDVAHLIQDYFFYLGQLVGKAALDGNPIDLPFSSVFYKLILSDRVQIDDLQVCGAL